MSFSRYEQENTTSGSTNSTQLIEAAEQGGPLEHVLDDDGYVQDNNGRAETNLDEGGGLVSETQAS